MSDTILGADAGGCEELRALVREWQIARRQSQLPAPGVDVVETYRHAVLRMGVVDEALARFNLDGPAGGALVGQPMPTESTGASLREELTEIIRWRFRTADGAPMHVGQGVGMAETGALVHGPSALKRAMEIADEIAPFIEEAVGER